MTVVPPQAGAGRVGAATAVVPALGLPSRSLLAMAGYAKVSLMEDRQHEVKR